MSEIADRYISRKGLVAYDKKTMEPIALGSKVISFRGEEALLLDNERVNEMRYGGRRSGKVYIQWLKDGFKAEYYDDVFGIVVVDPELENPVPL